MAMYIDDRYLNKEDSDFVELVTADISRFLEAATTNESLVLVFPAVSSRHRFLVHKSVEELPSLCSFSIGEGEHRRPVVCLEVAIMRKILGGTPVLVVPDGDFSTEPTSTVKPDNNNQQATGIPAPVTMTPILDNSESQSADHSVDNFPVSLPLPGLLPERNSDSLRDEDLPLVASSSLPSAELAEKLRPDHHDPAIATSDKTEPENEIQSSACENKHVIIDNDARSDGFDIHMPEKADGCYEPLPVKDYSDSAYVANADAAAAAEAACQVLSVSMKETCAIGSAGTESDGQQTLSGFEIENTVENKCTETSTLSVVSVASFVSIPTSDAAGATESGAETSEVGKNARTESGTDAAECNGTKNLPPLDSLIADIRRTVDAEQDASDSKATGEELNPALMLELKIAVGDIMILHPVNSYCGYLAKELDTLPEGSDRSIEIYDIPDGSITRDVLALFRDYRDKHFDIKWVDKTHVIGVFSTKEMAESVVVDFRHPIVNVQPLSLASTQTKLVAKRSLDPVSPTF